MQSDIQWVLILLGLILTGTGLYLWFYDYEVKLYLPFLLGGVVVLGGTLASAFWASKKTTQTCKKTDEFNPFESYREEMEQLGRTPKAEGEWYGWNQYEHP